MCKQEGNNVTPLCILLINTEGQDFLNVYYFSVCVCVCKGSHIFSVHVLNVIQLLNFFFQSDNDTYSLHLNTLLDDLFLYMSLYSVV